MALRNLLRHRLDWERPYIATDDARGSTRDFRKHELNVRCLVQPATAKDLLLFAQRQIVASHCIYFDKVLALQPADRFYRAAKGDVPARYFVVKGWVDQGGQDGRCFCVFATEQA